MRSKLNVLLPLAAVALFTAGPCFAQPFFFIGPGGGDFFDVTNWNTATDGTGTSPAPGDLPDSTSGAIAIDLIIDAISVEAAGQVDFGVGSLQMINGSMLEITGSGNDIDFNTDTTFTLTDSTLIADGDVVLEGSVTLTGGTVTALTDDVEIQDNAVLAIDGTVMNSGDNFIFDSFSGSLANATIVLADRLSVRAPGGVDADVVVVDTSIDVNGGNGDVDNVFTDNLDSGGSLTLLGSSTLLADTVEEEVNLIIGDTAVANLGGNGTEILDNGSTATLTSVFAMLVVNEITNDPRDFVINGLTGMTYNDDPSAFTNPNWNGLDATTLQLVPEPTAAVLACLGGLALLRRRN